MYSPKQLMLRTAFFMKSTIRCQFCMPKKLPKPIDWGPEMENAAPIAIIELMKAKYAMHFALLC